MTDNAFTYRHGRAFVDDVAAIGAAQKFIKPHCAFYVYLGKNEGDGHVAWLSGAAPRMTIMGPWRADTKGLLAPDDLPAETAPADARRELDEREVLVREWGTLSVDGATAPDVTLEGHLDICPKAPAGLRVSREDCRFNDSNGPFYVFILTSTQPWWSKEQSRRK